MEACKSQKRHQESYIPIEILLQILEYLPLKSLIRFKSTSKHLCSQINEIVCRRVLDKTDQRAEKFEKVTEGHLDLFEELKKLYLNRGLDACALNRLYEQLKEKFDQMVKVLSFLDDDDDDIDKCVDDVDGLRDSVNKWVEMVNGLQDEVDAFFEYCRENYVIL